ENKYLSQRRKGAKPDKKTGIGSRRSGDWSIHNFLVWLGVFAPSREIFAFVGVVLRCSASNCSQRCGSFGSASCGPVAHALQRQLEQVRLALRVRYHARRVAAQPIPIILLNDGVQERQI